MIQMRLVSDGRIEREEVATPRPRKGEVLIRVAWCGICGSDVHAFQGKHPFIDFPIVQGHEFSGTIERIGSGVEGLKVGDRVTVLPSLVCGKCFSCTHHRENICRELRVLGCQAPGAFADFVVAPGAQCFNLPGKVSLRDAALVEPLAVGVHACRRGGLRGGENVVVIGAGTIGLMTMMTAKALDCKVLQTDVVDYRLKLARKLGADSVWNAASGDAAKAAARRFGTAGADVVFECAGSPKSVAQAFAMSRKGSRIVMTAVYTQDMTVPMGIVQDWELQVVGTLMYRAKDYRAAIKYLRTGQVRPQPIVTHEIALEDLSEGYRVLLDPKQEKIKVVVRVGGGE